jgi:excisionase family DNA binding protein
MKKMEPDRPRKNYTVEEFCDEFRVSRDTFYRHVNAGKIKTIPFGRRRLVPATEVQRITENGL